MLHDDSIPNSLNLEDLRFEPSEGLVIREPLGRGYGYWAGGAKVSYDQASGSFVLFYRQRVPLEKGRGGQCAIALSDDGATFTDVWTASKEQFAANSIEVGHCLRDPSGGWRLYVSYEYAAGPHWRIDVICAPTIDALDVQSRRTVLAPFEYGLPSLKDPVVYLREGTYYVYMAGPDRRVAQPRGETLAVRPWEATFLGISEDGFHFPELRKVFEAPGVDTWYGRRARINSLFPLEGGYLATYDTARTAYDMYEEQCGLAWSQDGLGFARIPLAQPWVRSPFGCVRYVYGLRVGNQLFFYYEYTREDLSHELRVSQVRL